MHSRFLMSPLTKEITIITEPRIGLKRKKTIKPITKIKSRILMCVSDIPSSFGDSNMPKTEG